MGDNVLSYILGYYRAKEAVKIKNSISTALKKFIVVFWISVLLTFFIRIASKGKMVTSELMRTGCIIMICCFLAHALFSLTRAAVFSRRDRKAAREINENGVYLFTLYDDIIIPTELADVHYKQVITKRNRWIISQSDVVIIYTIRNYGGAYSALNYAKKLKREIVKIQA